ncbi:helix-turn-helix transcriptional regulator [Catellatospora sp. KI3]|uniref:helix-turn-helix domain-containing protein n=1 Tax=Catellatospora sp. KI3 TaxID=3041620 RepID=UPI002482AAD0|nr:helix-turn-helix transcriptional regulator [Catellatospora sp. KI3]MDI1466311.1 helix-turn-helix transcriptional regulator [Catellatospora sp. KI3]
MRPPHLMSAEPIGERIRLLRQQRGWSVRHAASVAGISHTQWSRIENGLRSADNRFLLAEIATALRVPLSDLTTTGALPGDRGQVREAVHGITRAIIEADLDYPASVPLGPVAPLLLQLETVVALRFQCDYLGAAKLLPGLLSGLHAAAFGPERAEALRAMVLTAETASFVIRYLGEPASAVLVADRARQAAAALADPIMLGMASWSQAHAATGIGLYTRAQIIADQGVGLLRGQHAAPGSLELLGQLITVSGFAKYAQGDVAGASAAVEEAAQIAERTGQSDALGLNFGPTNVAFWRITMEADGRDPGRAVEIARTVNPQLVPAVSRQVGFYIDVARALSNTGKDQEAVRMLLVGERLAPQRVRLSPIVAETLRGALERARRGAGWTELRGLCERVGIQI